MHPPLPRLHPGALVVAALLTLGGAVVPPLHADGGRAVAVQSAPAQSAPAAAAPTAPVRLAETQAVPGSVLALAGAALLGGSMLLAASELRRERRQASG